MDKPHPLNNQVVFSTILEHISLVADLKSLRLVCKQWWYVSLTKWRKTSTLNIYSFEPASLPITSGRQLEGCYDALFTDDSTTAKNLTAKPFNHYHLHDVMRIPSSSDQGYYRSQFWKRYGPHMYSLRLDIDSLIDGEFIWETKQCLVAYCQNLTDLQFGPWKDTSITSPLPIDTPKTSPAHFYDSSDDEDHNDEEYNESTAGNSRGCRIISDSSTDMSSGIEDNFDFTLPDSSSSEIDRRSEYRISQRIFENGGEVEGTLQKVETMSFYLSEKQWKRSMLFSNARNIKNILNFVPNVKNLTFEICNEWEKPKILNILKLPIGPTNKLIKLETLKFFNQSGSGMGNTQRLLLEYLQATLPPIKELTDLIYLPDIADRIPQIFKLIEETLEKLDICARCRETSNLSFPQVPQVNFTKLTILKLTFNYASKDNLAVFNFQAFQSMPTLQVFWCHWKWDPGNLTKPLLTRQEFYAKWNEAIRRLNDSGDASLINLAALQEFHLNVYLTPFTLNILYGWMENLKILETIISLEEDKLPNDNCNPIQLWNSLQKFTTLPESTIRKERDIFAVNEEGEARSCSS